MVLEKLSLNFIASASPCPGKADVCLRRHSSRQILGDPHGPNRIDAPLLDRLYMTFLIFGPPQLEFISRTPKLRAIRYCTCGL